MAQSATRQRPGNHSLVNHRRAVNEHISRSIRLLPRRIVRRVRPDPLRIEDCDVRTGSVAKDAPVSEAQTFRWITRHLANGFLERHQLLVAHELAQNPGIRAICPRTRVLANEDRVRSNHSESM